jgi:hypothetical protein
MKKVVVARSRWTRYRLCAYYTPHRGEASYCVVGYVAKSFGVLPKVRKDAVLDTSGANEETREKLARLVKPKSRMSLERRRQVLKEMVKINDSVIMSREDTERRLQELGTTIGLDIRFTGRAAKNRFTW